MPRRVHRLVFGRGDGEEFGPLDAEGDRYVGVLRDDAPLLDSQERDGEIVFDYQIKEGSALTKNAVNTLESLHYPKEITNGARRIIEDYETSGQWHLPEEGEIV